MHKLLLALFLWATWVSYGVAGPKVFTVPTRPGVTVRLLLDAPDSPRKDVLLIFPGGSGAHMFKIQDGNIELGNNFLVRTTPLFVNCGWAVVVVDVPSDHQDSMSLAFRTSQEHAADIRHVLDFLNREGWRSFYLAGTSRGTLSAAYLATALADRRLKGLVLTASLEEEVRGLTLDKISLPVLLVHHRDDGCWRSPFDGALKLKELFPRSPRVDLVAVEGGLPPQSDPCSSLSHHGFWGMEKQVVQAICQWLEGKPPPPQVGP